MQEITSPNGYRVKNIQPRTMHLTNGHTSYPHVLYQPLYTCKNSQIPNHPYQKHQCRRNANQRNVEIGRSKQMKEKSPVGARYPEETGKNTGLQYQSHPRNQQNTDRINQAFRHYRTQGFRERYIIESRQNAAS